MKILELIKYIYIYPLLFHVKFFASTYKWFDKILKKSEYLLLLDDVSD